MTEKEIRERLKEISEGAGIDLKEVTGKYLDFLTYTNGDTEDALKCIESYCEQRIPILHKLEAGEDINMNEYENTEDYSFNYALYDIMGDEIVDLLNEKYVEINANRIYGNEFGINIR